MINRFAIATGGYDPRENNYCRQLIATGGYWYHSIYGSYMGRHRGFIRRMIRRRKRK